MMPTGAGKSILFLLPASYGTSGTMIMIILLVTLRQDLVRYYRELGITCYAWSPRQPSDGVKIILVTPESVITEVFYSYLNRLRMTQELDYIMIDECHLCLDNQSLFRTVI